MESIIHNQHSFWMELPCSFGDQRSIWNHMPQTNLSKFGHIHWLLLCLCSSQCSNVCYAQKPACVPSWLFRQLNRSKTLTCRAFRDVTLFATGNRWEFLASAELIEPLKSAGAKMRDEPSKGRNFKAAQKIVFFNEDGDLLRTRLTKSYKRDGRLTKPTKLRTTSAQLGDLQFN